MVYFPFDFMHFTYFDASKITSMKNSFLLLCLSVLIIQSSQAQISARMFRTPDVSQTQIVFSYGGDIWIVDKEGGTANKLSSPSGSESP